MAYLNIMLNRKIAIRDKFNIDEYVFGPDNTSLLMYAVKCGSLGIVSMLLDKYKVNINYRDKVS